MSPKERFLSLLGSMLIRAYARTLRWRFSGDETQKTSPSPPRIWIFWHNRILFVPWIYRRWFPKRPGAVLTSASRDGGMLAAFVKRFGFVAARGSSSRRGAQALRELARLVEQGYDVGITPDGPRGPRYQIGPGAVRLAQQTGAPIVLLHINYSRYRALKSWDRFMLPLPFSTVHVRTAPPIEIRETDTEAEFEAERARIESELNLGRNDTF